MKKYLLLPSLIAAVLFVSGCGDDDTPVTPAGPQPTGQSVTYTLGEISNGISGTAKFIEIDDNSTTVEIAVTGTASGDMHAVHIHFNTAAESGGVSRTLGTVDGATGTSTINFNMLDDGTTAITYADLLAYDGYINVHNTDGSVAAQGDIGANELTGDTQSYDLLEIGDSGISGTAMFAKRQNETTLLTLTLTGTSAGGDHPVHIHMGNAATGGGIAISLSNVDGATGLSKTHIEQFDDETAVTYAQLLEYEGYVNIHLSSTESETTIARGNIGIAMDPVININVTNSGATAYMFNGDGMTDASNPMLTLTKGRTYTFTVNAPGHPFWINTTQGTGTGNGFDDGVTNNGTQDGVVTFAVPSDAPGLFYNCEFHSVMTNTITAVD